MYDMKYFLSLGFFPSNDKKYTKYSLDAGHTKKDAAGQNQPMSYSLLTSI